MATVALATTFWTPLLRAGRYRLSDGRIVEYSRADVLNAVRQGNRMRSAGLRAPVCWMHDPSAAPAYLSSSTRATAGAPDAWLAKGYIGEPIKFRVGADGSAEGLITIDDPKDAEQFRRVGGVSPRVDFDWRDERGKLWKGCTISHVAVTPRPIQRELRKAAPAYPPDYLSHATPGRSGETHYLGHATRIGDPNMAGEADEAAGCEGGEGGAAGDTTGCALAKIVDCLVRMGIKVGDATDIDDLASRLDAIASHTTGTDSGDGDDDEDDGDNTDLDGNEPNNPDGQGNEPNPQTQPAAMPPALMSHFTAAARVKTGELASRINKLFKTCRIDGPVRDRLAARLNGANLSHESFEPDGRLKPFDLLTQIEAYEALPAGKFATTAKSKRAALSHDTVRVDPPEGLQGVEAGIAAEVADAKRRNGG